MGVHDGDYTEAKAALGIPDDEPVFVIRGQDALAVPAIARYQVLAIEAECEDSFVKNLSETIAVFTDWQSENQTKKPD